MEVYSAQKRATGGRTLLAAGVLLIITVALSTGLVYRKQHHLSSLLDADRRIDAHFRVRLPAAWKPSDDADGFLQWFRGPLRRPAGEFDLGAGLLTDSTSSAAQALEQVRTKVLGLPAAPPAASRACRFGGRPAVMESFELSLSGVPCAVTLVACRDAKLGTAVLALIGTGVRGPVVQRLAGQIAAVARFD